MPSAVFEAAAAAAVKSLAARESRSLRYWPGPLRAEYARTHYVACLQAEDWRCLELDAFPAELLIERISQHLEAEGLVVPPSAVQDLILHAPARPSVVQWFGRSGRRLRYDGPSVGNASFVSFGPLGMSPDGRCALVPVLVDDDQASLLVLRREQLAWNCVALLSLPTYPRTELDDSPNCRHERMRVEPSSADRQEVLAAVLDHLALTQPDPRVLPEPFSNEGLRSLFIWMLSPEERGILHGELPPEALLRDRLCRRLSDWIPEMDPCILADLFPAREAAVPWTDRIPQHPGIRWSPDRRFGRSCIQLGPIAFNHDLSQALLVEGISDGLSGGYEFLFLVREGSTWRVHATALLGILN